MLRFGFATFAMTTLALSTLPSAAGATVIDFNELKHANGNTYHVYGPYIDPTDTYRLSSSTCVNTSRGPDCFTTTPNQGLGSLDRVGAALTNYAGSSTVTLARVDGAEFLVNNIDFAPLWNNFSGFGQSTLDLLFTFTYADGRSPFSETLTIANTPGQRLTVTNLDFSSYGALSAISFRPMAGSSGFVQFDNINVSATGAVPEPATWAMMIAGFGLAGAAMRRRKAAVAFA